MNDVPIIAYYNGNISTLDDVKVSPCDRAHMFGDAVYECMRVYNGQVFIMHEHMARLSASLRALSINLNIDITEEISKNIACNGVIEGMVYVQISRGSAPRNHSFYNCALTPNILLYAKHFAEHPTKADQQNGIKAITHDDLRWARCDIKTTNLLANCLIQTHANQNGAVEALLFRNGMLTEATASNVFLLKNETYLTPPLSNFILPGTRRKFLLERLKATGRNVIERPIEKAEIMSADEIFITSTIKEVVPVIEVDNQPIGKGIVGNHAQFALGLLKEATQVRKDVGVAALTA